MDWLDAAAQAEAGGPPEGPRAVSVTLVVEALEVIELQVAVAADALADAPLEAVGPDGEPQVEAGEALESVVDVGLHQVGHRVARRLSGDVRARRQVGAHGGVLGSERRAVGGRGAPGEEQEGRLVAIEPVVAPEIDLRLAQRAAD